jgi:hypothetical protein
MGKNVWGVERRIQFWWESLRQRDHLEDLSEDGNIILQWVFKKWDPLKILGSGNHSLETTVLRR